MEEALRGADSLLVVSPVLEYGASDADVVRRFVDKGGRLVVLAEPTPGQAVFLPEPAAEWGMLAALVTVGWLRRRRANLNRVYRSSASWSPTPG